MFDLLKAIRINKITETHSEKISDRTILYNSINIAEAKEALSTTQFSDFMRTVSSILNRKEERAANLIQYQQRVFNIIYEIEYQAKTSYELFCGSATDILYMYSNMKPLFDEMVDQIVDEYIDQLENIISFNGSDALKVYCLGQIFFERASSTVIAAKKNKNDELTPYVFDVAFVKMVDIISGKFDIDSSDKLLKERDDDARLMSSMHQEAYNNCDTLDKYIETYTNSFLYFCGAPDDSTSKKEIIDRIYGWIDDFCL